jgi:hypothetical protein
MLYKTHISCVCKNYEAVLRSTFRAIKKKILKFASFLVNKQEYVPTAVLAYVTYTTYLSVFNVLKSTRFTPLGIFKDFITSAGQKINF